MAGKGGFDIEMMRSLFQDSRIWIVLAQVKQTNITTDRATMRVKVETLPDRDLIIAQMTWEAVGNDGGVFMLPNPGDIVLVAMENGSPDNAYVIKRLTNKEDTIPQRALTGDLVLKALAGKRLI
jgi:uncharacterized protein involved in type VI secretion and phage assembly